MNGLVDIAGWNANDQLTIVGDADHVLAMERLLIRLGGDISSLEVSGPWHSPSIQWLADRVFGELGALEFQAPRCPSIPAFLAVSRPSLIFCDVISRSRLPRLFCGNMCSKNLEALASPAFVS